MMILQQTRGVLSSGGFDPLAAIYIRSVENAGATVTTQQRNAISSFFKSGKSNGWLSSMRRIYLPIWGVAAANAIDLISRTSGTFVGGVTHGSGFVQSNGTTGFFSCNVSAQELGVTASLGTYFALVQQADTNNDARCMMGTTSPTSFSAIEHQNTTQARMFFGNGVSGQGQIVSSAFLNRASQVGIFTGSYDGTTRNFRLRRSSGTTSLSSVAGIPYNGPDSSHIPVMCLLSSGVAVRFHNGRLGAYGVSLTSDISGVDALTLNLKTLWETCTGLSLP